MTKSKSTGGATQSVPTACYDMRNRPARITKPATVRRPSRRPKRVYRTGNGLVSLLKTPKDLISIVESNSLQSPLLRLPAELRHKIFKYALGGTHILRYWWVAALEWRTTVSDGGVSVSWHPKLRFALPRVCRQIYHEAATLVYSGNVFHFPNSRWRDHFFNCRKQAQIEAVRSIMLKPAWGRYQDGASGLRDILRSLMRCKGLRELCLKRDHGLWRSGRIFDYAKEAEDTVAERLAGDVEVIFI